MDIGTQKSQVTSDDQELAKVLAGITDQPDESATPLDTALPSLEGIPTVTPEPDEDDKKAEAPAAEAPAAAPVEEPVAPETPVLPPVVAAPAPAGDLSDIKTNALSELRPLVDKLSLSPEEMFDAYLLLIRSTDDKSLIEPAYKAAHEITDEARRAKSLLEIVKEIDYLSNLGA